MLINLSKNVKKSLKFNWLVLTVKLKVIVFSNIQQKFIEIQQHLQWIFYIKIRSQVDISEVSLIVPDFTISVLAVHVYIFLSYSFSFAFSFYVLASPRQDGMQINRKRKKRSENQTKKEKITLTTVVYTERGPLDSPLIKKTIIF